MRLNKAEVRVERLRERLTDRALAVQEYKESMRRMGWVWAYEKAKERRKRKGKKRR